MKQENLANAKVSARQPWYTSRRSLQCIPNGILVKCEVARNSEKMWTYSSSTSLANRKCICNFLFVRHSNLCHSYLAPFL